jgi:predicted O-linked N-acetylglucosamine transferase (SPINDLY family)
MDGGNAEWFLCLGNSLNKLGRVSDALRCYRKALRLDPRNAWAAVNLGNLQLRVGDAGPGFRTLGKAAHLVTAGSDAHAGILMGLCYIDGITESRLYEESRRWGDALLRTLPRTERPKLRQDIPGSRIRIGYVSPDFRQHSVAFFLEKVFACCSRERFDVFCYANMTREDDVTVRLRSYADAWRPISTLDDDSVARLIRDDGIDILVDLAGHTEGNRLGIFARRPAPVQVTWLGYPGTTGLTTMDYRLTDVVADPEGPGELYHTERLVRLTDGFLCYAPPEESPPPAPSPCLTANRVTFGSFNNPAKLSRETLRCWAGILDRVPGSILILKIYSSSDEATREKWMRVLASYGIDSSRVEILPRVSGLADHLALYGRVDIALDPFPYNGTTTTCEALWMGVPVVALSGERHSARVGASILKVVGCPELIAGNLDEYREIAVRLATDRSQLEAYRAGLRTQVESSSLSDGAGFVARLEQAFRWMVEESRAREALLEHYGGKDKERARTLVAIAQGCMRSAKLEEAEAACRKALALDDVCVEAHTLLGCALVEGGRYGEGIRSLRDALELDPGFVNAMSKFLMVMHYSPHFSGRRILEESLQWQERLQHHSETKRHRFAALSGDVERIRVGYLSSDFRTHSVSYFLAPLLEFHDRKRFEITCYASVGRPDRMTERLRGLSEHWRDVASLDTDELAKQIHTDGIHVLVDLSGHTGDNRLPVFTLRPAPVQVTWLGYPGTTGLAAMDYRLTDVLSEPPGADSLYSERLVRLPGGFLCYGPPDDAPPVGSLPLLRNGYVTFASFNNLAKITDQVISLWARILQTVEGSRLIVKSRFCADDATCRRVIARFQSKGAPVERIELRPFSAATSQHLAMYDEVDIALDTFPYNGTTTTCEALWMGVPVVTLSGDRHSGRVGTSILTTLGLETLVSRSEEEYLNICRGLASDIDTLGDLRDSLRLRMQSSTLCDGKGFARKVERAFRMMWRNRLKKSERSTPIC